MENNEKFKQKSKQAKKWILKGPNLASNVKDQVALGRKFILLEGMIDERNIPEKYTLIKTKYKNEIFSALVPERVLYFLANPGEGNLDEALDEIAEFHKEIGEYEDEKIENNQTDLHSVDWALTARNAYSIYLLNKLVNGSSFNMDNPVWNKAEIKRLNLNEDYVAQRVRAIVALGLNKKSGELKKWDLGDVLKHVTASYTEKETRTSQELVKFECDMGSHYEIREEYRTITKEYDTKKTEEDYVISQNISSLENEIDDYRRNQESEITDHDKMLVRLYTNLSYIAKENPEKQLSITPET